MATSTIPLTEHMHVTNGTHILYFYETMEAYLDNAISFMLTGFQQGQHIIYVDSRERYEIVKQRLRAQVSERELDLIRYVDYKEFYSLGKTFHFEHVYKNFMEATRPFIEKQIPIRAWGHVEWTDQNDILNQLQSYECLCEKAVNELGVLTVCAYSGDRVSVNLSSRLMRSHEYVMTDKELMHSVLYRNRRDPRVVYPSLSVQAQYQNEVDLYKQKLDFAHVVSHEVRNPLTVIKAYAMMLQKEVTSEQAREKLRDIQDYVTVIDNEITHIINTEEMLTSEALWQKSALLPRPVLQEVADTMGTKARTQNIKLESELKLTGEEQLHCNVMGLRLVVSNLLGNAIKYSEEGGTVRFRVQASADKLLLEFKDQGIGMSEAQLGMLFVKYQKLNVERGGQGVGLFMVKKLIDHFEGGIEVRSELNRGTEVRVELPLVNANYEGAMEG